MSKHVSTSPENSTNSSCPRGLLCSFLANTCERRVVDQRTKLLIRRGFGTDSIQKEDDVTDQEDEAKLGDK